MRKQTILSLFLPVLAAASILRRYEYAEDLAVTSSYATASPASAPSSPYPAATSIVDSDGLELRQVPRFVPVNTAPGAPNDGTLDVASTANSAKAQANLAASADSTLATSTSLILPPTIVVPSSATSTVPTTASTPPAITASPSPIDLADGFYVTTQWVATWLDSTSRTWVPQTITLRYKPAVVAPPPGKGEIGMGTLTGKTGVTRTVVLGAAPAQTVGVVRGIVAAVGVGIVGMVV